MSPQRLWQEADDVQELYSAIGADAAGAAAAGATDKADQNGPREVHSPLAVALRTLLLLAPRTRQASRDVLCHRRWRCAHGGRWHHTHTTNPVKYSTTGACAANTAAAGATCTPALALRSLQEVVLSHTGYAGATDAACTGAMHPATCVNCWNGRHSHGWHWRDVFHHKRSRCEH